MSDSPAERTAGRPFPRLTARADIQGLRALAVLLVVLDHAGVPFLPGGFVGVDVFFVVSGYLISMLLLGEAATTGSVSVLSFYARRARRILPAATVVLVAVAIFAAFAMPLFDAQQTLGDILWAAFFGANIHFGLQGTDYFQQGLAPSPVQHFWSLAVEEQFYLVWPALLTLVILAARRRREPEVALRLVLPLVAGIVLAAWVVSLGWSVVDTARMPASAYFSTFTRAWELATGALLALAAPLLPRLARPVRHLLGTAGLAAIGVAAVTITPTMGFPGYVALLPVLGTAAVIAAGAGSGAVGVARVLTVRPVTWFGDVSYSLYLWHWPVLVLGATYLGKRESPLETAALVAVAVVASAISYYAVENPLRRARGPLLSGRRGLVLWPVALGLTLGAALGSGRYVDHEFVVMERGGTPAAGGDTSGKPGTQTGNPIHEALVQAVRLAAKDAPIPFPVQPDLRSLATDYWQLTTGCTARHQETQQDICPLGDPKGSTTVVVFGDSHAKMWLPALDAYFKKQHVRMIPLVKLGCAPYEIPTAPTAFDQSCAAYRSWAVGQILSLRPALVIVSAESPKVDSTADSVAVWRQAAAALIPELKSSGARIRFVGDVSQQKQLPPECLSSRSSTMATCTARVSRRIVAFNAAVSDAADSGGVPYVSVLDLVCADGRCPMVADGIAIYRDQNHVTQTWAAHVSAELIAKLRIGHLTSAG